MSQNTVLTKDRCRQFSARARAYMLTYKNISTLQKENDDKDSSKINLSLIERCVKTFKTHWCVSDFENQFLSKVVEKMRNGDWEKWWKTVDENGVIWLDNMMSLGQFLLN